MNHKILKIFVGIVIIAATISGVLYWEWPERSSELRRREEASTTVDSLTVATGSVAEAVPTLKAGSRCLDIQARTQGRTGSTNVPPAIQTYRGPGPNHKGYIPSGDDRLLMKLLSMGARLLQKEASYTMVIVNEAMLSQLSPEERTTVEINDNTNLIVTTGCTFDSLAGEPTVQPQFRQEVRSGERLYLVQFVAPIRDEWRRSVERLSNVRIVQYVPNNALLVWADNAGIAKIKTLEAGENVLQWDGEYQPAYKIDPDLQSPSPQKVAVDIRVFEHPGSALTAARIRTLASEMLLEERGEFLRMAIVVRGDRLGEIARMTDVVEITPFARPRLMAPSADAERRGEAGRREGGIIWGRWFGEV